MTDFVHMNKRKKFKFEWVSVHDRPHIDHQPGRQFIRVEGSRYHSDATWARVGCGIACVRNLESEDQLLQYRRKDIEQICEDADMDIESAVVTHWMPAIFPAVVRGQ